MNTAPLTAFRLGRLMATVDLTRPCDHEWTPNISHGLRCATCHTFTNRPGEHPR